MPYQYSFIEWSDFKFLSSLILSSIREFVIALLFFYYTLYILTISLEGHAPYIQRNK